MIAVFVLAAALAAAPESGGDIALVGGDVYTVSGAIIPKGTVVIRGERILAVGRDLPLPGGARIIDCRGKVVTPGLIESASSIGLVEIDAEPSTVDNAPKWWDATRAAVNVIDAIDMRSTLIGVARRHGVTSAVSKPEGGLIAGRSAFIDLVGSHSRFLERAAKGPIAMHAALNGSGAQWVGGSRATMMMHFRRVLEDARVFKAQRAAFTKNALYPLAASRMDLAALDDVLSGKMRLIVAASRAADITNAIAMAKEEKIKIAIEGAEEGWMVADALAAAKVPVIVTPFHNLPFRFETLNSRQDNAALLAKAGVKVAVAVHNSHETSNLRFHLGMAVRAGLPAAAALRAATLSAAEIFGLEKQYGSIEVGKTANVVVWSGDPFEPWSSAEVVLIRGEEQPLDSRQTKLARRYIQRWRLGGKVD